MPNLKQLSAQKEFVTGGHRLCAGCGAGIVARQTLLAAGDNQVVASICTGCLEVATTIFPFTSWRIPFFHSAFENSAATCSGIETAYRALKKKGKVTKENVKFIAFGGDGGTYDIGFQSLSGAMERGHDMLYVCYNNQAYMNTGIQRSSATPLGAHTTTAPSGKVKQGKEQTRKNLTAIMAAHGIPYAAQSVVGDWRDYMTKVEKALAIKGPTFINIMQPCTVGWGFDPALTCDLGKLAIETCIWPCYEVENGKYKLTKKPKEKKPITEWLKPQARFKHVFKPGNEELIERMQAEIDEEWEKLLALCGES